MFNINHGIKYVLVMLAAIVSCLASATGPLCTSTAKFKLPWGITTDASGNIYVADTGDAYYRAIRKIVPTGAVSTLVNMYSIQTHPSSLAVDSSGNVYVADDVSGAIDRFTSGGTHSPSSPIYSLTNPSAIVVDESSGLSLYVVDNGYLKKLENSGGTWLSPVVISNVYGQGCTLAAGLAEDNAGNFYVSCNSGYTSEVFYIDVSNSDVDTNATLKAGAAGGSCTDGSLANGRFTNPWGLSIDQYNWVYVADTGCNKIRKIDNDNVSTVVTLGSGAPRGVVYDKPSNAIYVADTNDYTIRNGDGVIIAGASGQACSSSCDDATGIEVPVITSQPSEIGFHDQTAHCSADFSPHYNFSVTATASDSGSHLTYQWQQQEDDGSWSDLSEAANNQVPGYTNTNTSTMTVNFPTCTYQRAYRAKIGNGCSSQAYVYSDGNAYLYAYYQGYPVSYACCND